METDFFFTRGDHEMRRSESLLAPCVRDEAEIRRGEREANDDASEAEAARASFFTKPIGSEWKLVLVIIIDLVMHYLFTN